MSEPFLAEVRIVGFNFAPRGWGFCDGQILPINQNQSLYSLLGTTYGGDGRTSFGLPDMRGRVPMHVGASNGNFHRQGQKSGEETHSVSAAEMPQHDHAIAGTNSTADQIDPAGRFPAQTPTAVGNLYRTDSAGTDFESGAIANVGGSQAHNNMQPYTAVNFCIALQGLFPSRN